MSIFNTSKIERTIGGMKFAVGLLVLFSVAMIIGTFFESYFGTDFASRTVYKTPLFFLIQFGMFLSIVFAALLRMPPKKRLYGFYVVHTGLVIIGAGSFMTWYAGIDGSIFLAPNNPTRSITLSDDEFTIHFPDENRVASIKMPYTAFEKNVDKEYQNIKVKRFLPFADKSFQWTKALQSYLPTDPVHSSQYFLDNERFTQEFTVSLHPEAMDFENSLTLGPLTVHYLPQTLSRCFKLNPQSKLILWDRMKGFCFTPEEKNIQIKKSSEGNRFFVHRDGETFYSFFPDVSPWPMDKNMKVLRGSHLRVFSQSLFEKRPNLFLFGKSTAFYDKDEEKWFWKSFNGKDSIDLPWMGFTIRLLAHEKEKVPSLIPEYTRPIQKNNQLIKGNSKAVEIEIEGNNYWVTDDRPIQLLINGKRAIFRLGKETLSLPFELVLTKFKMDKDPGTNNPASYESFVRLFSSTGPQDHHIFMNNPLKYSGFTFYQASYSKDKNGNYSSTLSANVDPGRFWKYLGSILLFIGSLWHYYLNYAKKKPDNLTPLIDGIESKEVSS